MFIVETKMVYGWINCWSVNGKPHTFATREEAQAEIDEFFADLEDADMLEDYDREDYRITEQEVIEKNKSLVDSKREKKMGSNKINTFKEKEDE